MFANDDSKANKLKGRSNGNRLCICSNSASLITVGEQRTYRQSLFIAVSWKVRNNAA